MKPATGAILRRVGLLIELACLLVLVSQQDESRTVAGVSVRHLLLAGAAVGFVLWGAGLTLIMRAARRPRE
jgi:hypothetical protein